MNRSSRQLLGLVGLALVLGLLWWVQHGDTGSSPNSSPSGSVSVLPRPTATATRVPTRSATPSATPRGTAREAEVVALSDLPPEGRAVVRAIHAGGPFRYDRDGITFGNREGLLPPQPRGYYREYTVPTPGESDRGARRIVVGEDGTLYYTEDHYDSFREIQE